MSVDAASSLAPGASRTVVRGHAWTAALAGSLALAFAARLALAWTRATPVYFPDEYIYTALGRSFAALHGPTIRGGAAHFPALLQPLLTAPAWRAGSVEAGYRIVQAIECAFWTLTAIPVYLLARRLALGRWIAILAAAIALLVPDGVYTGFVLADPIAYPLVAAALLSGVLALAQPRQRTQIVFLAFSVLATAARTQFVVLPLCYLAGAVLLGLRERRLRIVAREQRAVGILVGLAAAAALAAGPTRVVGYYHNALHLHPHPLATLVSAGQNLLVLAWAGGWILVPGALLGLVFALVRPRSRTEAAFAALTVMFAAALLVEATVFGGTDKVHERYAFSLVPLLAIAFGLYASRGWPVRRVHLGLLAGMALLTMEPWLTVPSQPGHLDHAPFLYALHWLEGKIGSGDAALVLAAVAGVLAAVAAGASAQRRLGAPAVLVSAALVCAVSSAGAVAFDSGDSRSVVAHFLPGDYAWVDHAHVGRVTLVAGYQTTDTADESQMFWNRSIQRVAVLPGSQPPDAMAAAPIQIDANGTLLVHGSPLQGALLLDQSGGTIVPRGGKIVAGFSLYKLWQPQGPPRLAFYMPGRFPNGELGLQSAILAWPTHVGAGIAGWLRFDFSTIAKVPGTVTLTIRHGTHVWHFRTRSGHTVPVRIPVCSKHGWAAALSTPPVIRNGFRLAAGHSTLPTITPDPSACASGG